MNKKDFLFREFTEFVSSGIVCLFFLWLFNWIIDGIYTQLVLDGNLKIDNLDQGSVMFGFLLAFKIIGMMYIIGSNSPYKQDCFRCQRIRPDYED